MNGRLTIIVILLLAAFASVRAEVPLQDDYQIRLGIAWPDTVGVGWGSPPLNGSADLQLHYESMYGVYPDMVLWTDIGRSSYTIDFTVGVYPRPPQNYAFDEWNPTPEWDDIEEHLYILRRNIEVYAIDTLTTSVLIGVGSVNMSNNPSKSYQAHYKLNIYDIISANNTLYEIWSELWFEVGNPATKTATSSSVYVVKKARDTVQDSLQWAYSGYEDNNPDYLHSVLLSYTDNLFINRLLFNYYYNNANCDSVTAVGDRFIYIYENLHSYVPSSEAMEPTAEIESKIHDICVDGYPQLEKYYGIIYVEPEE